LSLPGGLFSEKKNLLVQLFLHQKVLFIEGVNEAWQYLITFLFFVNHIFTNDSKGGVKNVEGLPDQGRPT